MTVQKGFFENYRGGHDVWADMTTENTVNFFFHIYSELLLIILLYLPYSPLSCPPQIFRSFSKKMGGADMT